MIKTYKIETQPSGKKHIIYKHDGVQFDEKLYWQPSVPTEYADILHGYIDEDRVKWAEMYDALLNSGTILTKMRTAANMGTFLMLVFATIQSGANGFPNQSELQTLLRLAGWNFTAGEKTTINNYLANNNFSITVT